jgi:hypothetical protein
MNGDDPGYKIVDDGRAAAGGAYKIVDNPDYKPPAVVEPTPDAPGYVERGFSAAKDFLVPPLAGAAEWAVDTARAGVTAVGDAYRGEEMEFDFREIPQNVRNRKGKNVPIVDKIAFARGNPLGMGAIYAKNLDDEVKFDKDLRPYVIRPDGNFYLNISGFSKNDLSQIISEGLGYVGAARFGTRSMPFKKGAESVRHGLPWRAIKIGALSGGVSLGYDALAKAHGSEQGFDYDRAVMVALLGTGFEVGGAVFGAVIPPVARRTTRLVKNWVRAIVGEPKYWAANGAPTALGAKLLKEGGIDGDLIGPDFRAVFARSIDEGLEPAQAAQVASNAQLPYPIPQTVGEVTGSPGRQLFEDAAAKGHRGSGAADVMSGVRTAQDEAMFNNMAYGQAMAGGRLGPKEAPLQTTAPPIAPGQGAEAAAAAIRGDARRDMAGVQGNYNAARAGEPAFAANTDVSQWAVGLRGTLQRGDEAGGGYHPVDAPRAYQFIADIYEMAQGGAVKNAGPIASSVSIGELQMVRRQIGNAQSGTTPTDAKALGVVKRSLDDLMINLSKSNRLRGDPAAVQRWNDAIASRAAYGAKWQGRSEVDKIVTKLINGGYDANGATEIIFGGKTGLFGGTKNAEGVLTKLKEVLPPHQWQQVKEEAFIRMLSNQKEFAQRVGAPYVRGDTPEFSGANFSKMFTAQMFEHSRGMQILFEPAELAFFRDVAKASVRVQRAQKGWSNTATQMIQWFRRVGGPLATTVDAATQPIQKVAGLAANTSRANRSAAGHPGYLGPNITPGAGALTGIGLYEGLR